MKMNLLEIREAMRAVGDLGPAADFVPASVRTDSRLVGEGDIFFCIRGERFDGHAFAAEVIRRGACAVVAERMPEIASCGTGNSAGEFAPVDAETCGVPILMVTDTVQALGQFALRHRMKAKARVVGVTGTAGKTTVKEMLAAILAADGPTARNMLNLNNQIGMPMSMLEAEGTEKYWVMEAGISEPRDMDELGPVLRPDVAVVVNVGPGHLEKLGSVRGVADHKARLFNWLNEGGVGLANADYPELVEAAESVRESGAVIEWFSSSEEPSRPVRFSAKYLGPADDGDCLHGSFRLTADGRSMDMILPWRGHFAAENIAAAAGAAMLMGVSMETVERGLRAAVPTDQRFVCRRKGSWLVIDDSYNANPLSMASSIASARELAGDEPLVLVLGEMLELGEEAEQAHYDVGRAATASGAHTVFWHGGHGRSVRDGMESEGGDGLFLPVEKTGAFIANLAEFGPGGGVILFKGSRGNRMERFAKTLMWVR